jgi:dihydrolipoamide dehydrogenase
MADTDTYDLIVIGSGPGGYVAAIRAAQLGMRVACVEKDNTLGGTCLNVGCIPSKALLDSSHHFREVRHSLGRHGIKIDANSVQLDLPAMMARKDNVVGANTRGIATLFKKNKVDHVVGLGRIASPTSVEVSGKDGTKRMLGTKRVLIATGSAPIALKTIPFDGTRIISSDQAIALPEVPKRLVVIGAGAIGLELGSVWNRLGSEVLVLEFMDRIVPLMDREMTTALHRSLEKQGMKFRLKTGAQSAKVEGNRVKLDWAAADGSEKGTEECDRVLVAIGRRPFTEGLGAKELGVQFDPRGFITVDPHYETSVPGVFAIGDVIGGAMLAHKAEEEGVAAVEIMAGHAGHVNYLAVPNIVYTHPELASVGMTEEEAREKVGEIKVGKFPFTANGRARAMDDVEGSVKVIGDAKTDRLLGVHILGARASDMIAEAAVMIEMAASVEDLARSVHAHPTLPEAVKEAALAADNRPIHI